MTVNNRKNHSMVRNKANMMRTETKFTDKKRRVVKITTVKKVARTRTMAKKIKTMREKIKTKKDLMSNNKNNSTKATVKRVGTTIDALTFQNCI